MTCCSHRFSAVRAICTLVTLAVVFGIAGTALAGERDLARYEREQFDEGAKTMPLLARLAYRDGVRALAEGDKERAETLLFKALSYQPNYPDPYFTLVRLRILELDPEAGIYLVDAFLAIWKNFAAQGLLTVNAVAMTAFVLIMMSLILCVAFAFKYLPFAAHQMEELLRRRFRAGAAGLAGYLLLLVPLVLLPGVITTLAYLTIVCWIYMRRRERVLMFTLLVPFILMGVLNSYLKPLSIIADPSSMTSLAARANDSMADPRLIKQIESSDAPGLESEKNLAAGILYHRRGDYVKAGDRLLEAIAQNPEDPAGYINLGNVNFVQGRYEKALQGYRKAEGIEPMDAVCQHDLAQAYIKTLLMKEASQALLLASDLGIDNVKASYAEGTLDGLSVIPKLFSNTDLWRMAWKESRTTERNIIDELLLPFTGFPMRAAAWILLAALTTAVIMSRLVSPWKLTFQCSNCGSLTCSSCCAEEKEMTLCKECASAITHVSSEKVIGALLRQKRQAAIVRRGRASRITTRLLPGIRDIAHSRVSRASKLSFLFSLSVVQLIGRGFVVDDTLRIIPEAPLWQLILPTAGIIISYLASSVSKPQYDFRTRRGVGAVRGHRESKGGPVEPARAA